MDTSACFMFYIIDRTSWFGKVNDVMKLEDFNLA